MIIGGIAADKGSNSARKSYARSVGGLFYPKKKARFNKSITFGEENVPTMIVVIMMSFSVVKTPMAYNSI